MGGVGLMNEFHNFEPELRPLFLKDFQYVSDDILTLLGKNSGELTAEWKALATAAERGKFVEELKWAASIGKEDEALFQIALKDWKFGNALKNWDEYLLALQNSATFGYFDYISYIKNLVKINVGKYSLSEAYSIFSYTTIFYYRELNQLLRTGVNTVKALKAKNLLNQALLKMPKVPANTQYFRGVELAGDDLANFLTRHKEGATVTYDEFISCANNRADAFIDATKSNVKITIETKANSKAHTIWDLSFGKIKKGTTDEALFRTQSKFIVTKNKPLGNNVFEINLKEID